jgi:acetyl esterase/lipase
MTRYLLFCLLLASFTGASVRGAEPSPEDPAYLVKVGLDADDPTPPAAVPDETKSCEGVTFSRNLRYGENEQNVLDVATGGADIGPVIPRPVLLFVAGESFSAEDTAPDAQAPMQDAAMCFAARHGMVGVRMSYRLAPANPWPSGARDVAAATAWLHQNVDLFGGNRDEIVAVGYSVGAFHVASLLAHPEFQITDSDVAAAVLVSGIYRASADASAEEKSYFGADASQYDQRSAWCTPPAQPRAGRCRHRFVRRPDHWLQTALCLRHRSARSQRPRLDQRHYKPDSRRDRARQLTEAFPWGWHSKISYSRSGSNL